MIGAFLIDRLRKLGDFLWEVIDKGEALIRLSKKCKSYSKKVKNRIKYRV